jgi:hypothetical protein
MMRRSIPALTAALFSAVALSAYAIDEPTDPNPLPPQEKHAKKKKSESPTAQQSANPADQAQPSGTGGVQEGSNAPGRGDPNSTTMTPGGAAASPAPTDSGRAYKQ